MAWSLLALTLIVAVGDWIAVGLERRPVEYALKPLTMVALAALVVVLDLPDGEVRWWHLAAVIFSLAGDVFLMLPGDREEMFLGGLSSFFVAHVAYIVGMAQMGVSWPRLAVGAVITAAAVTAVGRHVVAGARERDRRLFVPVLAYMGVLSVMAVTAIGVGRPLGVVGAVLFVASDSLIGWTRFVGDFGGSRLAIITTYHLGQVGLVLALASAGL